MKTLDDVRKMKHFLVPGEVDYLYSEAKALNAESKIINIGVYYGASAASLMCGMAGGTLVIVDVFKYHNAGGPKMVPFKERTDVDWTALPKEDIVKDIISYGTEINLEIHEAYSDDVDTSEYTDFDLVFIDGDHTEHGCLLDALKYAQTLKSGGKLLFHDYTAFEQVRTAIAKFLSIRKDFKMVEKVGSICTLKKD